MLATQLALPVLRHGGTVVNVSSSGGWDSGAYGSPEYGAAKAGLIRFTTAVGDFADRYGRPRELRRPALDRVAAGDRRVRGADPQEQADSGGLVDPEVIATTIVGLALDPRSGTVVVVRAGRPAYRIDQPPTTRTGRPPRPSGGDRRGAATRRDLETGHDEVEKLPVRKTSG